MYSVTDYSMHYTLIQIQSFVATVRSGFHVSRAARQLHSSQSVVSKHLKSFEEALGGKVFTRSGKRLIGLTDEGAKILTFAERILRDHESIRKIGEEASQHDRETLLIATTPTLARYLLAAAVQAFTLAHPNVRLHIQVDESDKTAESVRLGLCGLGIAPIGRKPSAELTVSTLTRWTRLLIGLPECPLFKAKRLTLEMIASVPIIAFETPTVSMREAFDAHGIRPRIAVTTSNPEVMKAYSALGLGVAVVAAATFDAVRDAPLVSRDVSDLFPSVQIGVLERTDSYRPLVQKRFLDYLRDSLPETPN